jgi:hypothetical protein
VTISDTSEKAAAKAIRLPLSRMPWFITSVIAAAAQNWVPSTFLPDEVVLAPIHSNRLSFPL